MHVRASLRATWDQLKRFDIGDGWVHFETSSILMRRMKQYIPGEQGFLHSRQQRGQLDLIDPFRRLHTGLIFLTIPFCIVFALRKPDYTSHLLLILIVFGIVINAWVSGTFANAIDRLGCKCIWTLVLATLLLVINTSKRVSDQGLGSTPASHV
jgi:hypothetical protein